MIVIDDCIDQDVFTGDNNMGLVKQVVTSQTRSSIRRLTKTFITLSLADLATRSIVKTHPTFMFYS